MLLKPKPERESNKTIEMARLSKIDRPSMVQGPLENEDQAANTAAKITTVAQLQHWAHTKPQAVLDEMNQVWQYYNDTVIAYNKLIDQLQASAKGVEALEYKLQELSNNYKKQTDDLLQTRS